MTRSGVATILLIVGLTAAGCSSNPFASQVRHVQGIRSPSERTQELRALTKQAPETKDPNQREALCQQLATEIRTEDDPNLRGEIPRTLGAYGGPTCDTVLRVAVSDPDPDVRVVVCGLWGTKGTPEAGQLLAGIFAGDVDHDVRLAAARALGNIKDPITVRTLGPALNDTDPAIRHRAAVALESSTGVQLDEDVDRWREWVKTNGQSSGQAPSLADRMRSYFW